MTTSNLPDIASHFPTIHIHRARTVLVKFGGAAMESEDTRHAVCQEIAALNQLGIITVVVHGGGKEISHMMTRVGLTPLFVDGLRITDAEAMRITEMVLSGSVNSDLVSRITRAGAPAIGLSGRDARLLEAVRLKGSRGEDLGQTGEVRATNVAPILAIIKGGFVPVISPVGETAIGEALNLNADYAAAAIAGALHVDTCIFLTDVAGVKKDGEVQSRLSRRELECYIQDGTISGGMIPKVQCALRALDAGCFRTVICNASIPLAISKALMGTELSGTTIIN